MAKRMADVRGSQPYLPEIGPKLWKVESARAGYSREFVLDRMSGGKFIPPASWEPVGPTPIEIALGGVNWDGLRLMRESMHIAAIIDDPIERAAKLKKLGEIGAVMARRDREKREGKERLMVLITGTQLKLL